MANVNPFGPNFSKTKKITATSTSSSITFDATDVQGATPGGNAGHSVMRIVVLGTAGTGVVFLRWGTGAQTALLTDMPILPGMTEVFTKANTVDTVAAITSGSDTATIWVTCGEGQ